MVRVVGIYIYMLSEVCAVFLAAEAAHIHHYNSCAVVARKRVRSCGVFCGREAAHVHSQPAAAAAAALIRARTSCNWPYMAFVLVNI